MLYNPVMHCSNCHCQINIYLFLPFLHHLWYIVNGSAEKIFTRKFNKDCITGNQNFYVIQMNLGEWNTIPSLPHIKLWQAWPLPIEPSCTSNQMTLMLFPTITFPLNFRKHFLIFQILPQTIIHIFKDLLFLPIDL